MRTLAEMKRAAFGYLTVNTPFDHGRAMRIAEDFAGLTVWAERARALLLQMKDETFKDNKISGRSQREGQQLIDDLRSGE